MNALVKIVAPIVVVLVSIGSLFFVSKLAVTKKEHKERGIQISSLQGDIQRAREKQAQTDETLKKTQTDLLASQNETAKVTAELTTSKGETKAAQELADQKSKALDEMTGKLTTATKELEDAKTAATKLTGEMDELKKQAAELAKLEEIKTKVIALTDENKEFGRQLAVLRADNRKLQTEVEDSRSTPVTLRGQIAAVQDRWGFVVLNMGEEQHVRANAQFLIYRANQLVGKVQVVSVGAKTCIAELLPEYQRSYPRVGDLAVR